MKCPFVLEGILHQSRADIFHGESATCGYCRDGQGIFSTCRTLAGFRDGCCANCMASGDGYRRCSFVPGQHNSPISLNTSLIYTDDVKSKHMIEADAEAAVDSMYRSLNESVFSRY